MLCGIPKPALSTYNPIFLINLHVLKCLLFWQGQSLSTSLWTPDTQDHTRVRSDLAQCDSIATSLAWTLPSWQCHWFALIVLTFTLHCGLPLSLLSVKSLRLYPMYCSLTTPPPPHIQSDFWTQVQDLPFIPIKSHLVRFRPLIQPVQIILDLGPVSCLPLCFMSSANLIIMLSMFSPKSSMEELGQRQGHSPPGHWRLLSRLTVIDPSAFTEYSFSSRFQFTGLHYHPAHISPRVHYNIRGTVSNILLLSGYTMLECPCNNIGRLGAENLRAALQTLINMAYAEQGF